MKFITILLICLPFFGFSQQERNIYFDHRLGMRPFDFVECLEDTVKFKVEGKKDTLRLKIDLFSDAYFQKLEVEKWEKKSFLLSESKYDSISIYIYDSHGFYYSIIEIKLKSKNDNYQGYFEASDWTTKTTGHCSLEISKEKWGKILSEFDQLTANNKISVDLNKYDIRRGDNGKLYFFFVVDEKVSCFYQEYLREPNLYSEIKTLLGGDKWY